MLPINALAYSDLYLGRLAQAEDALRRASARNLQDPFFLLLRFQIAFLKGDRDEMDKVQASVQGNSGAEDSISDQAAFALANSGRLREAMP